MLVHKRFCLPLKNKVSSCCCVISSISDLTDLKPFYSILEHRPLTKLLQSPSPWPGVLSESRCSSLTVQCFHIPPPAVTWSPSLSASLWVPKEILQGNAVHWSSKCMAYPCPFPAHDLLFHRCLSCGLPQIEVTNCRRPVDMEETSIYILYIFVHFVL